MDTAASSHGVAIVPPGEFALHLPGDGRGPATLLHVGRRIAVVQARAIEAQFRFQDGSTLILASDDTAFEETLSLVLLGPDLRVRGQRRIGGATTPGFLAYAEALGPNSVAFCWHDHEQVVQIGRRRRWFGLRRSWLTVRDLVPQRDPAPRR